MLDLNNKKFASPTRMYEHTASGYIIVWHTEQPFNRHLIVMIVVAGDTLEKD